MKCTVFLSHDIADITPAASLRRLLEATFRRLEVDTSSLNSEQEVNLEQMRSRLRHADLVVSLMSRRGLGNPRLYFEAGAGCVVAGTVVLYMDGIRQQDLTPPLSLLPGLNLDEQGLHGLVGQVAKATGCQAPARIVGIEEALWSIKSFFQLRNSEEDLSHRPGYSAAESKREPVDKAIASLYRRLREHLRQAAVVSLSQSGVLDAGLTREHLKAMPLQDLFGMARKHNVPIPEYEGGLLMTFEQDIPIESSPRWKKMNACKLLEGIDEGVRRFEKALGGS